jgi:hypothetical protein
MRRLSLSLSSVLVSCGIISPPCYTQLYLCNPEYYMYCPISLYQYDVIQSCNCRMN